MIFVWGLLVGLILGVVLSVGLFVWSACETFAKD